MSQSSAQSKLSTFFAESLQCGSLRGFKFFELYVRGKEELIMRVYHDRPRDKLLAGHGGVSSQKLLLSKRMKRIIMDSTTKVMPASPCDTEMEKDASVIAFLIAGYSRYERPYVWLRSNHQKVLASLEDYSKDDPLRLDTIKRWKTQDVRLWEIVAEVLDLATKEEISNPFAVNHEYFNTLSISWCQFREQVERDIDLLFDRHYRELQELHREGKLD